MRQPLIATLDDAGLPCASISFSAMWELVEYLSYQRAAVVYHYDASHFTVTFHRTDLASAQAILDEWVHAGVPEPQTA
jgi:uncharacterized protein YggE